MITPPALPNWQKLTPTHFLERAGVVYAQRTGVVDGEKNYTWQEFRARSRRFASALRRNGLKEGDRVAFLALNSEPMLLAHFGVPLAGQLLVAINTRLNAQEISYILEHSGARLVFYSRELVAQLAAAPSNVRRIDLERDFESFLEEGSPEEPTWPIIGEGDPITINYTSGTTGRPKGVVFHARGAFLNALAMAIDHKLTAETNYLWTLPLFHCNGWTFPWALAAVGAKSLCIPRVDPAKIWRLLDTGVTHFCAAPTILIMLASDPAAHRLERPVRIFTAGAPPSPAIIARMTELNFELEHVYGLTETYGPFTINVSDLAQHPPAERARFKARQGFANLCAGEVRVVDDEMRDVPADGQTMGEVIMRGNAVMTGYFADPDATAKAFHGGWFHSGDGAVCHPDGEIELRDRLKDIIISGGENISTIEIEQAVANHPAVMECAVVAIPDDKWGEVPKAFVSLLPNATATETDIIEHCRSCLAHFKAPRAVEFGPLPKTATGKVQKYVLREREWRGREKRIN